MAMSAEEVVAAIKGKEKIQVNTRVNAKVYEEFTKVNKSLGITNGACLNELMEDFVRNYKSKENGE